MKQPFDNTGQEDAGFTLVELLVVMIVISVLSLAIALFVTSWLQQAALAQARTNLLTTAESTLDNVTNDIRLSGSVDTNNRWADQYAPGSGSYSWQSSSTVLILAKIAVDSSNTVIFSDPVKYITQKDNEIYYLSGTTLYRRTLASSSVNDAATTTCPVADATSSCPADTVVATNVSNWSITYYDANDQVVTADNARSVQLSITVQQTLGTQVISASYVTRMVFRNE